MRRKLEIVNLLETIHTTSCSCQTMFNIGWIDLELSWLTALMFSDIPKTENYCMSGPDKFDEKSKIGNPIRNQPQSFLE